jgi:type IV pilus assembly protein PilO
MASKKNVSFDLTTVFQDVAGQFRGLNTNEPGQWPWLPKLTAFVAFAALLLVLAWFAVLSSTSDELQAERDREPGLRQEYRSKLSQAVNLSELRKQKIQVQEYVTQLEKQLPGKAEMDALLSDINQAGLGRGLQFELFRPGQVAVKDYYAELPISIKVTGRYHDIGAFAADVANLSRIVTLHNLNISGVPVPGQAAAAASPGTGALTMDATARTYRYLDPAEVESQRKAKEAANKAGAKK